MTAPTPTVPHSLRPAAASARTSPDGRTALAFQRVDGWVEPSWPGGSHPQQFHLDFSDIDIDAAEPDILALGAKLHEHQPSRGGGFRVYLDPAGHPFCLGR